MPDTQPPKTVQDRMATLTDREREVLSLIGEGLSLGEIAARLHRSVETIKSHRRSLARKLGTRNRVLLARAAVCCGLTTLEVACPAERDADSTKDLLGEGVFHSRVKSLRCTPELVVRTANYAACEWLRLAIEEVEGRSLFTLPMFEGCTDLAGLCRSVVEQDSAVSTRIMMSGPGGAAAAMQVDVSPVPCAGDFDLPDLWISVIEVEAGTASAYAAPQLHGELNAGPSVPCELLRREADARRRSEVRLREVLAGISWTSGPTSFRQLVRHLSQALDVEHAILSSRRSRDSKCTQSTAIAGWSRGTPLELFDFDPSTGPCAEAMTGHMCHVSTGLRSLFPESPLVKRLGAESFLGIPLAGADGSVLGVLSVLSDRPMPDLSEHLAVMRAFAARAASELRCRESEVALHAAITRHERLADICPTGLYYCDSDGRCVYVNRRAAEMVGRDVKQCLDGGWLQAVHPADREWVGQSYRETVTKKLDFPPTQYRFLHTDGSVVTVLDAASRDFSEDDELQGWIGALTLLPQSPTHQSTIASVIQSS